jgi:hypothetical protein
MEALLERTENSKQELSEICLPYFLNSFYHFFFYAFNIALKRVEGVFYTPSHLVDLVLRMENHTRTSTVAPRFHLKSTVAEGYIAWKLLRMEHNWNEWSFMSFTSDLGAYHTKRLKRHIQALPELFRDYRELTDAGSILYYTFKGREFYCEPEGIMSFKRGKHPNGMICDDILKDPEVRLDISQLEKITRTFFEEVEQMPKEELHLVGTPQDQEDLFAQLESKEGFDCKRYDAEVMEGVAWWENNPNFCWKALKDRESRIGHKAYLKEFRCQPVRGVEGYLSLEELNGIISKNLINYQFKDMPSKIGLRVGGFDIGKKTHPSHLSVFEQRDNRIIQIHSKFMDGWNYTDQIDYLSRIVKEFGLDALYYDDTRAEFEASDEQGKIPSEMTGVVFSSKSKFTMATELDKVVTKKIIEILPDDRQKRQILTVDCDLKAPETSDGHGDAFFSLCLAVQAWADNQGDVATLM